MRVISSRTLIVTTTCLAIIGAFAWWVAQHTYWDKVKIPTPLKGEARINPFYAAQKLTTSLGARAERHRVLGDLPRPSDVLVLGSWHWDVVVSRRARLEKWVESGGRLVVDRSLIGSAGRFSQWSGIDRLEREASEEEEEEEEDDDPESQPKRQAPRKGVGSLLQQDEDCRELAPGGLRLCAWDDGSKLVPLRKASWVLRDERGPQAVRISVGRGSVTVINAQPFFYRRFLDGDHARLFVAATQLARGDRVHFLTEESHPNLLTLLWMYGAPAVGLALAWIALALWRNGARLGPLMPPPATARRSLGEQIRGTGQFVIRFGGGAALHRAQIRALDEAATRRIPRYSSLTPDERARQLAGLTNIDAGALLTAIHPAHTPRPIQLRGIIELLETARRRILQIRKGY